MKREKRLRGSSRLRTESVPSIRSRTDLRGGGGGRGGNHALNVDVNYETATETNHGLVHSDAFGSRILRMSLSSKKLHRTIAAVHRKRQ